MTEEGNFLFRHRKNVDDADYCEHKDSEVGQIDDKRERSKNAADCRYDYGRDKQYETLFDVKFNERVFSRGYKRDDYERSEIRENSHADFPLFLVLLLCCLFFFHLFCSFNFYRLYHGLTENANLLYRLISCGYFMKKYCLGFDTSQLCEVAEWNGFKREQAVNIKDGNNWHRARIARIATNAKRNGETFTVFLIRWGNSLHLKTNFEVRAA